MKVSKNVQKFLKRGLAFCFGILYTCQVSSGKTQMTISYWAIAKR